MVRAVDRGLRRAAAAFNARPEVDRGRRSPASPPASCSARCASSAPSSRWASAASSRRCPRPRSARSTPAASLEVARAAARLRSEEGLLVVGIDLAGQEKGYPAEDHAEGLPDRSRGLPRQDRPRRRGLRARVDLPGDRRPPRRPHRPRHLALRRDQDHEPAHPRPQALRREPRGVHRRQAHHHRGLPDLEPADGAGARRRPAAATRSPRCGAAGSRPRSAPTTGSSRTRPSATRSRARSRPSRSRRRRCATS